MTDITVHSEPARSTANPAGSHRLTGRVAQLPVLRTAIVLSLALCLTIPESEVRAKVFKMNLIVKNLQRAVL